MGGAVQPASLTDVFRNVTQLTTAGQNNDTRGKNGKTGHLMTSFAEGGFAEELKNDNPQRT